MAPVVLAGQPPTPLEAQVKAAYLLNFGRFATWPGADAVQGSPPDFSVCILGRDPFGPILDSVVSGERIDGLPVQARRLDRLDEAGTCRVVFISRSERGRVRQILQALSRTGALTVSDIPRFVDEDGMIELVADGNRVRFAVNVPAAERAGLAFGSELLRVAISVKTREGTTIRP